MNKTAKATEIKLSEPMKIVVRKIVKDNPTNMVVKIEKIIDKFLKAIQSNIPTRIKLKNPETAAPEATDSTSS